MPFELSSSSSFDQKQSSPAAPVDRLLAQLLDLMILGPCLSLLYFPIFRALENDFLGALLHPDQRIQAFTVAGLWLLSAGFYSTLSWCLWKATPGQKLFGLQVLSWDSQKLTWSQAWLRYLGKILALCWGGIPFLEVFGHRERRTLYDRMGESTVVQAQKYPTSPNEFEMQVAQSVARLASVAYLFLIVSLWGPTIQKSFAWKAEEQKRLDSQSLCLDVHRTEQTHPVDSALFQYLTREIDQDCLEQELDFAIWKGAQLDMSWVSLAKAVLNKSDRSMRNDYLQQACALGPKSLPCEIGEIWGSQGRVASSSSLLRSPFAYWWALQSAQQNADFETRSQLLADQLFRDWSLNFFQTQKLKLEWDRGESQNAFVAWSFLEDRLNVKQKNELTQELCASREIEPCELRKVWNLDPGGVSAKMRRPASEAR